MEHQNPKKEKENELTRQPLQQQSFLVAPSLVAHTPTPSVAFSGQRKLLGLGTQEPQETFNALLRGTEARAEEADLLRRRLLFVGRLRLLVHADCPRGCQSALPLEPAQGGLLPNLPHGRDLPGVGVGAGLSNDRRQREGELEPVCHEPAAAVDAATIAVAAAVVVRLLVGCWDVRHLVDLVQRYRREGKRRKKMGGGEDWGLYTGGQWGHGYNRYKILL